MLDFLLGSSKRVLRRILPKTIKKALKKVRYNIYLLRILRRPLNEFRYNIYSQIGEDGVVEELFRRLGIRKGWVVEFGAWDGVYLSNTYRLIEEDKRFRAVYIEGDRERYKALQSTAAKFENRIIAIHALVQPTGEASLERLLDKTPVPNDFELLSIDVDGIDYQIWEQFGGYSPKVVIIEVDSSIPPDKEQIHGSGGQYASFRSMLDLGKRKGYTCVCHTGNMFFVRNDLLPKAHLKKQFQSKPELLFCRSWLSSE